MRHIPMFLLAVSLMLIVGAGAIMLWKAESAPYRKQRKAQIETGIEVYLMDNKDVDDAEKSIRILEIVDDYKG